MHELQDWRALQDDAEHVPPWQVLLDKEMLPRVSMTASELDLRLQIHERAGREQESRMDVMSRPSGILVPSAPALPSAVELAGGMLQPPTDHFMSPQPPDSSKHVVRRPVIHRGLSDPAAPQCQREPSSLSHAATL